MADTRTLEQDQDDRTYEPPTLTVLGTVRQVTSEGDVTEPPK